MKNEKIIVETFREFVDIDNSMEKVKKITELRQLVIYHKRFDFEILCQLEKILKGLAIPYNSMIKCLSVEMPNCKIKLIRKD